MVLAFLCLILIYLTVERIRHVRRLKRIPLRIHVNGTRGKSNVTRLIAAALRQSGIRTLAKTTGTLPKLILPDGSEETIRRPCPANILEQMKIVKKADRLKVEALVVECMALDPSLQFISEAEMIRSTVGIITNVRPDHFEVMGGCLDDVAEALSQSIPARGILVTGDRRYYPLFSDVASRRGSRAVLAWNPDTDGDDPLQEIHIFRGKHRDRTKSVVFSWVWTLLSSIPVSAIRLSPGKAPGYSVYPSEEGRCISSTPFPQTMSNPPGSSRRGH